MTAKATNAQGKASFGDAALMVQLETGQKLNGVQVIRIRRDAVSYFVFLDPLNRGRIRSGFLREFEPVQANEYRVTLRKGGTGFTSGSHSYSLLETAWILDFLRRSARIDAKGAAAEIQNTRNLYLRNQGFVLPNGNLSQRFCDWKFWNEN